MTDRQFPGNWGEEEEVGRRKVGGPDPGKRNLGGGKEERSLSRSGDAGCARGGAAAWVKTCSIEG